MTQNLPDTMDDDKDEKTIETFDPEEETEIQTAAEAELHDKEFDAASDDHAMVQKLGTKRIDREVNKEIIHKQLADDIYDHDKKFVREYAQNSETAIVRRARQIVIEHEGDEALVRKVWIDDISGEKIAEGGDRQKILAEWNIADENLRLVHYPVSVEKTLQMAKENGFDPTINVECHKSDRRIVWEDNGIGMTVDELDRAYTYTGNTGVGSDGSTGGQKGLGALTGFKMTDFDGDMLGITASARDDAADFEAEGFGFTVDLNGANAADRDIPDGFTGTKFEIPVQQDVNLNQFRTWMLEYCHGLRVPVLYKEFESGSLVFDEEYGGNTIVDTYDDPPIVIHRPGEFTAVAGPNVSWTSSGAKAGTYLVSMPIERNTRSSISTAWSTAVQLHDEQGLIVGGPNRGLRRREVDSLHTDDVPLPEPTSDRDRLKQDNVTDRFWAMVQRLVKEQELSIAGEFAQKMDDADHPADAIQDDNEGWKVFRKMVSYHGSHRTTDRAGRFENFVENRDEMPDFDDETRNQIFRLFEEVEVAPAGNMGRGAKKKHRREREIGKLLLDHDPEHVFMAKSTGGNFKDYHLVVHKTYDDALVIVLGQSQGYHRYEDTFGFKKLKEVPLLQSDDHDFDVLDTVHERQQKKNQSSSSGTKTADSDDVDDQILKLRSSSQGGSGVDKRWSVGTVKAKLENGNGIASRDKLVLFSRSPKDENISDHMDLQKYAAIAVANKEIWEELEQYDDVMTLEEFKEYSYSTVFATEEGAMTVEEMFEDDRMVALLYGYSKEWKRFLKRDDYHNELRSIIGEWIVETLYSRTDEEDRPDYLIGVADEQTFQRAAYALGEEYDWDYEVVGIRPRRYRPSYGYDEIKWKKISLLNKKKLKARTRNWDNDSEVYNWYRDADDWVESLLDGFHEQGIDPTKVNQSDLGAAIANDELDSLKS